MAGKYIDLASRISDDLEPTMAGEAYICNALRWLDEHPDQVPRLTVTASEFDEAVESCVTEDATVPPHTFAARLGVVCVPDPEPTNAEKWQELLARYKDEATGLESFSDWADRKGLKAPGGDDE